MPESSSDIIVKLVETETELEAAIDIRFRVFVAEQHVPPEEELDEEDAGATHVIALQHGSTVGTGRLLVRDSAIAVIGRMAVDQSWRRRGVGGLILDFLEEEARAQGLRRSVLHAQEYVKSFYAAHGYLEHGEPFDEVNIPHIEMRKEL
jgi:predicted GNAT family N-acyltransferase